MVEILEKQNGIRDLPISDKLRDVLEKAATEVGVERIVVTSGGQCEIGTCSKRIGSTRHDLGMAADLEVQVAKKSLAFTDANDLEIISDFVTAVCKYGATGIGAGPGYMGGEKKLHVGFGNVAVWGAGGKGKNAPEWLKKAAQAGWSQRFEPLPSSRIVLARIGLNLRSGPGREFPVLRELAAGTQVNVNGLDGAEREWARIDLRGDGFIDGHAHRDFLSQEFDSSLSAGAFDTDKVQDFCEA